MSSHLTNCGIPGIGAIPYGLHLCHFYPTREELLDGLIPYFQAGIANHERCMWITSDPLSADDVRNEISKFPDLEGARASGQLIVLDYMDWYGDPSKLDPQTMINRWREKEAEALKEGYRGLRITGNTSFVTRDHWAGLMEYERQLHRAFQGTRIVTCCSYARLQCDAVDVLEIVRRHDAALDRSDDNWQVFTQHTRLEPTQDVKSEIAAGLNS